MFAIVDIESSGGNFQKDRIIEIAIIIFDGSKIINQYTTLINPLTTISPVRPLSTKEIALSG